MSEPPRIVLDTNVLVSALVWQGKPTRFFDLAGEGEIALFSSPALVSEFRRTILRAKFAERLRRADQSAAGLVASYEELATIIKPAVLTQSYSRDPDDDHVIACAPRGFYSDRRQRFAGARERRRHPDFARCRGFGRIGLNLLAAFTIPAELCAKILANPVWRLRNMNHFTPNPDCPEPIEGPLFSSCSFA